MTIDGAKQTSLKQNSITNRSSGFGRISNAFLKPDEEYQLKRDINLQLAINGFLKH